MEQNRLSFSVLLLPTLLFYGVAFLAVWLIPMLGEADGEITGMLCLAPIAPAFSLLRSVERAFLVNTVARRRLHTANAGNLFLKDYATFFAAVVAGSIIAAVILTTWYNHVLDTSADSNNDPRVPIIWGVGYLLVPLVPAALAYGTMRMIRKHYRLTTQQSWSVLLISLIPDIILFIIFAIIFMLWIWPILEEALNSLAAFIRIFP